MALCPDYLGEPVPDLDFTEARDSEWQWYPLGHIQACTSLQSDNHASTPPLKFFTGRMPFLWTSLSGSPYGFFFVFSRAERIYDIKCHLHLHYGYSYSKAAVKLRYYQQSYEIEM